MLLMRGNEAFGSELISLASG